MRERMDDFENRDSASILVRNKNVCTTAEKKNRPYVKGAEKKQVIGRKNNMHTRPKKNIFSAKKG